MHVMFRPKCTVFYLVIHHRLFNVTGYGWSVSTNSQDDDGSFEDGEEDFTTDDLAGMEN